jgi:hypothetical protein
MNYCLQCGGPYGQDTAHMCTVPESALVAKVRLARLESDEHESRQNIQLLISNQDELYARIEELEQTVREQAVELERLHYHDFTPNDDVTNRELLVALTKLIEDMYAPYIPPPYIPAVPQPPVNPYIPQPWQQPIVTWSDTNPYETVWETDLNTDPPLTAAELANCELERPVRKTPCGLCNNCVRKYRT